MKASIFFTLLLPILAACQSQEDMDHAVPQRTFTLSEGYQTVFSRLNKSMRACDWGPVDGQLYSDLGYGELTIALNGHPYEHAKIARSGSGSIVELKSLRRAMVPNAADHAVSWMEYWARGGTDCQGLIISEPPDL